MTSPRPIDALFVSHYEDLDKWHNDHVAPEVGEGGLTGPRPEDDAEAEDATTRARLLRQAVRIDGHFVDQPRLLSKLRYGTTAEHRRYDSFAFTHLSGSYYRSLLAGHGYEVVHVQQTDRLALAGLARRYAPRWVLISSSFLSETARIHDVCRRARALWPDAGIVLGGLVLVELARSLHPLAMRHLMKAWGADAYVVSALGEEPLLALLPHGPADLARLALPSTWVRDGASYRLSTERAEQGPGIDETYVRWTRLDPATLYHTVNLRTARSCAFQCNFCTFVALQGAHEVNRPETLALELDELARNGAARSLIFTDDTFNVPAPRFKELCRALTRHDFAWYSFCRPQHLDEEAAQLMADSGCKAVFIGLEAADDGMLKRMNKSATCRTAARGIELLKKHGITCHVNFIIGFPGDVPENTRKIVPFMDDLGVDFFCASPWYSSPTAAIHEQAAEYGLEGKFWRWKHDTMDVARACELEIELLETPKHAVFSSEIAQSTFWGELLLLSNGFSVDEVRTIAGTYNRFAGRDLASADLAREPELVALKALLETRELPVPPSLGEGARVGAEVRGG
ncbi:MAG: radical SAM protein [Planctomycetes bacterium]|nr:radical SAM protein [Planctomycetota bacterium]